MRIAYPECVYGIRNTQYLRATPSLVGIGKRYGKTAKASRILDNGDLFDFSLTDEEMTQIAQLDRGERVGPDPDNFHF